MLTCSARRASIIGGIHFAAIVGAPLVSVTWLRRHRAPETLPEVSRDELLRPLSEYKAVLGGVVMGAATPNSGRLLSDLMPMLTRIITAGCDRLNMLLDNAARADLNLREILPMLCAAKITH